MGRGGSGNDYVFADAQDGGGTNNANFGTPPDGSNPRMQMYLWSNNLDGDFDNGVIAHEYGHGISNRLTGGPSNTSCLGNAEQMGEGWSDFMALMLVTNWATANKNDSRGIGTYVLNQPTNGLGIRQYPYSYNMAVSLYDYNYARTHTAVHALGSAWCAMLWDMTWNIIDITPASTDVYGSSGGNNVALRLVLEGMKLQPCSPGFVDGRDAILLADQILYNGQYRCAIWAAFARRGLGYSASQGSSSSMTDGSQATDMPTNPSLTGSTSVSSAAPYQTVTYTMKVQTECTATPNLDVECTLPSGLTYISGGTYTAATNKVSFTNLNIPLGTSANYTFQALVNNTNAFPYYFFSDDIENGTANWTAANAGGNAGGNFQTSTLYPHSGTTGWNANELAVPSAATLISASIVLPASGNVRLSFWHKMLSEPTYDGGIVEISTNGGSTWQSLSALFLQNGYNSTLANTDNTAFANGTSLFSGTINMQQSLVNLNSFVGQTVKFRFRFGSDTGTGGLGWFIDDVQVINATASLTVNSTLKAGATTYDTDAVTVGLDAVPFACTGAPISGTIQGVGMVCPGAGTTLTTLNTAVGPNITYQWKTGTTAGGPYNTNLGTATTQATGNLNSDNYYIVQATCTQAGGSMAATPEKAVIMPPTPSIAFSNPASGNSTLILCSSTAVTMTCTTPNVYEYLWYKNGVAVNYALTPNFTVANNVSGTNTYTVAVSYINGASCLSAVSAPLTITTAIFSATVTPAGPTTFCANSPTTLNGNTAAGYNYQWKRGTTPVGTNSSSYVPNTSGNHNVTITEVNGCMKTSAWVNIIVNPLPTANAGVDKSICTNVSTTIGSAPAAGYSYNWQPPTHLSSASISNPSVSAPNAATTAYTLTVTNTTTTCSNTDMVNVTGLILPATPTLNSTTTPVCQGTTIALSPSNVAAATSVQWYKNNVVLYNQAPTFVTTLSAATASPDAYKIKSKNAAGCFSGFSNIVNTQINAAPTPTITSTPTAVGSTITVCVLGGTSGTAALTANIPVGSPAVTYSWQQSVSGVYTNVAAGANYTASVTNNATNKTFRVEATYSNACAKTSAARTVKLVTSGCTPRMGTVKGGNLTEIIIESDLLTAYPNPTEGLLNVSIENCQATEAKLFLYNTLGQIVAEKEMLIVNGKGVETLDLREMAMGVYSLSFQTKDTQKVQKVVKE